MDRDGEQATDRILNSAFQRGQRSSRRPLKRRKRAHSLRGDLREWSHRLLLAAKHHSGRKGKGAPIRVFLSRLSYSLNRTRCWLIGSFRARRDRGN
jgi:hypothetical protein